MTEEKRCVVALGRNLSSLGIVLRSPSSLLDPNLQKIGIEPQSQNTTFSSNHPVLRWDSLRGSCEPCNKYSKVNSRLLFEKVVCAFTGWKIDQLLHGRQILAMVCLVNVINGILSFDGQLISFMKLHL